MVDLWLFGQDISILFFLCGALYCLVNARMSDPDASFGAPAPSHAASLQRHGDFNAQAASGQLFDPQGKLPHRFGGIY
jgi:hypothetical protein